MIVVAADLARRRQGRGLKLNYVEAVAILSAEVMEAARENGLLIGKGGMFGNVLRVTPPMNVGRTDVDQFIEVLDKSLAACSAAVTAGGRS